MSSSLLDCPVDVLLPILEQLARPDLLALSVVHSSFRTLVEPLIYREFDVRHWAKDKGDMDTQCAPLIRLLRSIVARPELGNHIQSITLSARNPSRPYRSGGVPRISVAELNLQQIGWFLWTTEAPHAQRWLDDVRSGVVDGIVTTLLALAPNLTSLVIGAIFSRENYVLGRTVLHATVGQGPRKKLDMMQRLQDFTFEPEQSVFRGRAPRRGVEDVIPFFYLPRLSRLRVRMDNPPDGIQWPAEAQGPPRLTNLQHLGLRRVAEPQTRQLVSLADSLRSFEWRYENVRGYDEGNDGELNTRMVHLEDIIQAISPSKNTLEELKLTVETSMGDGSFIHTNLEMTGSLAPLRSFEQIKVFQVTWSMLMGRPPGGVGRRMEDVIPRNVQRLIITSNITSEDWEWPEEEVIKVLAVFATTWKSVAPSLRRVEFREDDLPSIMQPYNNALIPLFSEHDLEFEAIGVEYLDFIDSWIS